MQWNFKKIPNMSMGIYKHYESAYGWLSTGFPYRVVIILAILCDNTQYQGYVSATIGLVSTI